MDKVKIQQAIALLQAAIGTAPSGAAEPQHPPMPLFDEKLSSFSRQAEKLDPEIQELTKSTVKIFTVMKHIIAYSTACKKPDEAQNVQLQGLIKTAAAPILEIEKKDAWKFHAKALKECINAAFWVFTNAPEVVIKNAIDGADFNANKFKVAKKMEHNEWYNTLIQGLKALIDYANEYFKQGLDFNPNGTASWATLLSGGQPKSTSAQQNHPATTVTKKEEAPVKKAPVRENKNGSWFVQNFENEMLAFKAEEVEMRNTFFLENLKNCLVEIKHSKFKNLMISKAEKLVLVVKDVISGIEIMNSKGVEVRILGSCPSVSVDKSDSTYVVLPNGNKNTDVVSSKATQLNVTYAVNAEDVAKDYCVPEQVVTRWNEASQKFETKVYAQFM